MLESDRSEKLVASENGPRRRSMGLDSIWSTPSSSRDQRQLALDPTSGAPSNSPARPPATPLPQSSFSENFHAGASSMMHSNSGYSVSGQFRDPYSAGLGVGDVMPSYRNTFGTNIHRAPETFGYQAQTQIQTQTLPHPHHHWSDATNERLYQANIDSPNMYVQSQLNYPSTPSISSQNVSPHFSQNIHGQSFVKYEGLGQGLNTHPNLPPLVQQRHETQYYSGQPSSTYSSPQILQLDSMARTQDPVELSSIDSFARLHLNDHTSSQSADFSRETSSHIRRHSFGDSLRPKNIETSVFIGANRLPPGSFSEKLQNYFAFDAHRRVKIDYRTICACYEKESELLKPEFELPNFKSRDTLGGGVLVLVAFKAGRLDIFRIPSQNTVLNSLQTGDLVIVDADRGFDLGKIVRINISVEKARVFKMLMFLEHQSAFTEKSVHELQLRSLLPHSRFGNGNSSKLSELNDPKNILAFAKDQEIESFLKKQQEEEEACQITLETMGDILNPNKRNDPSKESTAFKYDDLKQLTIIDAEYQFDRKKLTFYFSSPRRLDFRDFLNVLFKIFKARIWMEAVSGIPYEYKASLGRRYSQPSRNENTRSRSGYSRERSSGRYSRSSHSQNQSQRSAGGYQQSPEVGNMSRSVYSRSSGPEYVSSRSALDSASEKQRRSTSENKEKSEHSFVPRMLRESTELKTEESSDAEESCVMKSLVYTLNQ